MINNKITIMSSNTNRNRQTLSTLHACTFVMNTKQVDIFIFFLSAVCLSCLRNITIFFIIIMFLYSQNYVLKKEF